MLALNYAFGLYLLIVPGFWLTPLLRYIGFRRLERLSLSVAMGPILVSMVMMCSCAIGVPVKSAAFLASGLSIPALWWMAIELKNLPFKSAKDHLSPHLLIGLFVPILWIIAIWVYVPNFRIFNWHAMMHLDMINALSRDSFPPEEPEMAGLVCSYSWFINLFWYCQAALTTQSSTTFLVLNNVVMLTVQVLLGYALGRRSGLPSYLSWFSTGLTVFGTSFFVLILKFLTVPVDFGKIQQFTPFLAKYLTLDGMPFAFPFLTSLLIIAIRREKASLRDAAALFLLSISLGFVYPVLLPAAGCIIAFWFLRLVLSQDFGRASFKQIIFLLTAFVGSYFLAIIGPLVFIKIVSVDRAAPSLAVHSFLDDRVAEKWIRGVSAIGGMIILGIAPLIIFRRPSRRFGWQAAIGGAVFASILGGSLLFLGLPKKATLTVSCAIYTGFLCTLAFGRPRHPITIEWLAGLGCLAFYVTLDVVGLEYKYLLAASIYLSPVAATGLLVTLRPFRIASRVVPPLLFLTLASMTLYMVMFKKYQIPSNLNLAPRVNEYSFPMQLDSTQQESHWVDVIRENTEPNTIVVSHDNQVHLSAFLNRSMYIPIGGNAGYSMDHRFNMTHYRGHSATVYDQRMETVRQLYVDESKQAEAIAILRRLNRPLAIHVKASDQALRSWLLENQIGKPLLDTPEDSVWLIPGP